MEDVVETLKVLWPSPPVPTMSHCNNISVSHQFESTLERVLFQDRAYSYQPAHIPPLFPTLILNNINQCWLVDLRGRFSHHLRACCQDFRMVVALVNMERPEEECELNWRQRVGEDKGDCCCDFFSRHGLACIFRRETLEKGRDGDVAMRGSVGGGGLVGRHGEDVGGI